jgi:hypothetical protein
MATTTTVAQTLLRTGRRSRSRRIAISTCAAAAGAMLLPITSAVADTPPLPIQTHCPAAMTLTAVNDFVYEDFAAARDLNGNGYVCVKQDATAAANALDPRFGLPPGSPLYLVGDDSIVP